VLTVRTKGETKAEVDICLVAFLRIW
jgi:hypothetical protein